MENYQINSIYPSANLQDFLRLSDKEIGVIKKDYLLDNPSKTQLTIAISKFYLRSRSVYVPVGFSRLEWLIGCLFFMLGHKIIEISKLLKLPPNQVKIFFFSFREKIINGKENNSQCLLESYVINRAECLELLDQELVEHFDRCPSCKKNYFLKLDENKLIRKMITQLKNS